MVFPGSRRWFATAAGTIAGADPQPSQADDCDDSVVRAPQARSSRGPVVKMSPDEPDDRSPVT